MIFFVADMFAQQYEGGAELTTEAIIVDSYFPCNKILSSDPKLLNYMKNNTSAVWIFGNFSNVPEQALLYAAKNLDYFILEYDYKYCKYRSPGKHKLSEGKCDCEIKRHGKLVSIFLNNSKMTWWMSKNQLLHYQSKFPFLDDKNNKVLNSVFSNKKLNYILSLDTKNKNDTYLILNSPSWIKGVDDAIKFADEKKLKYELIWNLTHKETLKKLAKSKGIIFFPKAGDTCPRMTIEAKLLDCELILNDNVQHRHEPWFKTRETTLNHLKQRTKIFWDEVELLASENLSLPVVNKNIKEKNRFIFVVPFYNCAEWIEKCVKSIVRQKYSNFKCYLVDDMSTDNSCEKIKKLIKNDNRFELIQNKDKKYALGNIAHVLGKKDLKDDDVVILMDGDDWLSSSAVLSKLNKEYKRNVFLTYGSYVYSTNGQKGVEPSEYPDEVIKNSAFRKDVWRASHLRSFKYHLWKKLDHSDLKNDGKYFEMTYDQAIMLPLLEMSAERSVYIPEVLYVYNRQNPLSVDKIKAKKQSELAVQIRNKKPYKRI